MRTTICLRQLPLVRRATRSLMLGLALASMCAISAAQADDPRDRGRAENQRQVQRGHENFRPDDREWRDHEGRAQRYWRRPHIEQRGEVYAPPLVYYPPQQYQEPGINLIIPFNIR